jgi:hypothetical protein
VRQSSQINIPQSAHIATIGLPQRTVCPGAPYSNSIWQAEGIGEMVANNNDVGFGLEGLANLLVSLWKESVEICFQMNVSYSAERDRKNTKKSRLRSVEDIKEHGHGDATKYVNER